MLLSRHWLNKYVDLKGINNKQITTALNSLGFEVEKTTDFKKLNDPLVIGRIEESNPIPNTKLTKNKVRVNRDQHLSIVCGAPNVRRNQYVIVAKPGQKIASGMTLETKKIQGETSQGMICALNEMGIANQFLTTKEKNEIYDLGKMPELKHLVGHSIRHFGMDDFVWDLDLTLNRSDALSAFQLAKELASYFQVPLKWPVIPSSIALLKPKTEIKIDNNLKPKIISLVGKSLEVRNGQNALSINHNLLLKKVGFPSTENFYEDLANLNTWETGQPLILVDRNKLLGNLTLQTLKIHNKNLIVLTSNGEIVQIIGQPTTRNFAVDENTKTILALALKVDENLMRQQSRHFAMNPAFQRYTKPLSVATQEMGLKNYERLLANYRVLRAKSPIKAWLKAPSEHHQILTSLERINQFLGTRLTQKDLVRIFKDSDLIVKSKNEQLIITRNPLRTDVMNENDIMEEVARLYGYEKIPSIPLKLTSHAHSGKWLINMENRIHNYLNALGFSNIKTYSLIGEEDSKTWNSFNYDDALAVISPLSLEHSHYRQSLIPSLLKVASANVANGRKDFKLWEIADIYSSGHQHHRHLLFGLGGKVFHDPLNHHVQETNYPYVKGLVEAIAKFYGLQSHHLNFEPLTSMALAHPHASAIVKYKTKTLGHIIRPITKVLDKHKLPITYLVELDLGALTKIGTRISQSFQPLNKFQVSKRALSFVLPQDFTFTNVIKHLLNHVHHLTEWKLIDQYQDREMLEKREQGLTVSFAFNHADHQLTEAEINHQWNKVLANAQKIGLKIR